MGDSYSCTSDPVTTLFEFLDLIVYNNAFGKRFFQ